MMQSDRNVESYRRLMSLGCVLVASLIAQKSLAEAPQFQLPENDYLAVVAAGQWSALVSMVNGRPVPHVVIEASGRVTVENFRKGEGGEPISGTVQLPPAEIEPLFTAYVKAFGLQPPTSIGCASRHVSIVDGMARVGWSEAFDVGFAVYSRLGDGEFVGETRIDGLFSDCPCEVVEAVRLLIDTAVEAVQKE